MVYRTWGGSIYTCSALPGQATAPTLLSRTTTITVFVDLVNIILDLRTEILECKHNINVVLYASMSIEKADLDACGSTTPLWVEK